MTIKLPLKQVEALRMIHRGANRCPPLNHTTVRAMETKGLVREVRVNGAVSYALTEKGHEMRERLR